MAPRRLGAKKWWQSKNRQTHSNGPTKNNRRKKFVKNPRTAMNTEQEEEDDLYDLLAVAEWELEGCEESVDNDGE